MSPNISTFQKILIVGATLFILTTGVGGGGALSPMADILKKPNSLDGASFVAGTSATHDRTGKGSSTDKLSRSRVGTAARPADARPDLENEQTKEVDASEHNRDVLIPDQARNIEPSAPIINIIESHAGDENYSDTINVRSEDEPQSFDYVDSGDLDVRDDGDPLPAGQDEIAGSRIELPDRIIPPNDEVLPSLPPVPVPLLPPLPDSLTLVNVDTHPLPSGFSRRDNDVVPELHQRFDIPTEAFLEEAPRVEFSPIKGPIAAANLEDGPIIIPPRRDEAQTNQIYLPSFDFNGVHTVQIASFLNVESACAVWEELREQYPNLFSGAEIIVRPQKQPTKTIYRLRIGAFSTKGDAMKWCEEFKLTGGDCFAATR